MRIRRITRAGLRRRAGKFSLYFARYFGAVGPDHTILENFPAGYNRWIQRRSFKLKSDFPDPWRFVQLPEAPFPRLGVVVHVFYPELLQEIVDGLAKIPVPFDLLITNSSGQEIAPNVSGLPRLRELRIFPIANHGRDILPLVSLVNLGALDPYEILLKAHTKRSEWREAHSQLGGSGDEWREGFIDALLGSEKTIKSVLGRFASEPSLGLVTAPGNVLGKHYWGGDERITKALLRRIGLWIVPERLKFAAGSMYWIRGFVLQGLRSLDLSPTDFEYEQGQVDGTTAHGIERAIGILTEEAGFELSDDVSAEGTDDAWRRYLPETPVRPFARAMAFYLPQFHRFPENERWWGEGFTEWSNVTSAVPVYPGHTQPLLPGKLGFYDISNPATLRAQVSLASDAGLEGFMYYYYWFAGKRLMDIPIESHAKSNDAGPFCLMWANENWTRRWDGSDQHILIGQDYHAVPATQFIHDVMHLLKDERYIRVDGRPILAVYRITQIPNFTEVIHYWRAEAEKAGLDGLEVLTVDVGTIQDGIEGDPRDYGLDGYLEFAPHNMQWTAQAVGTLELDPRFEGHVLNYGAMADAATSTMREGVAHTRNPGVMINFDNTARRQWKPDLWYGANPYTFRRWLRATAESVVDRNYDRRLIFINAWNEWAEGAVLEPSQRFGSTYLLATRDALTM